MFEQAKNFEDFENIQLRINEKSEMIEDHSNQDDIHERQTAEYDFNSEQQFKAFTPNDQVSPFGRQQVRLNSKMRPGLESTLNPKLAERLERVEQGYNLDHRANLFNGSDRVYSQVSDNKRQELYEGTNAHQSQSESIMSSKMRNFTNNLSHQQSPGGPNLDIRRQLEREECYKAQIVTQNGEVDSQDIHRQKLLNKIVSASAHSRHGSITKQQSVRDQSTDKLGLQQLKQRTSELLYNENPKPPRYNSQGRSDNKSTFSLGNIHKDIKEGNLKNFGLSYLTKTHSRPSHTQDINQENENPNQVTESKQITQSHSYKDIISQGSKMSQQTLEQLFKGEKSRNQVLQKQVKEIRTERDSYREEVIEAKQLKSQNIEYQELILKYEEQSRIKEQEWLSMQEAVRHKVDTQDQKIMDLSQQLEQSHQNNQEILCQLEQSQLRCHDFESMQQNYGSLNAEYNKLNQQLQNINFDHDQTLMQMRQQHQQDMQSLESQLTIKYQKDNNSKDVDNQNFVQQVTEQYQKQTQQLQQILQVKDQEMGELRNNKVIFEQQVNELEKMVKSQVDVQTEKASRVVEEKVQFEMECEKQIIKYRQQISDLKSQLSNLQGEHEHLKKKKEKNEQKQESVIHRQTQNISQLVNAAQNLQSKMKSLKSDKETQDKQLLSMTNEKRDSQRYTELIELRFKEISQKEEESNNKLLDLLDEVSKLTQENQSLLQKQQNNTQKV